MKSDIYVRVEKLEALPSALFQTVPMSEWVAGADNPGKGLPIGYTVEGFLLTEPKVGQPLRLDRRKRNNVDMIGDFQTSDITQIEGSYLTTLNSVYRIAEVEPPT